MNNSLIKKIEESLLGFEGIISDSPKVALYKTKESQDKIIVLCEFIGKKVNDCLSLKIKIEKQLSNVFNEYECVVEVLRSGWCDIFKKKNQLGTNAWISAYEHLIEARKKERIFNHSFEDNVSEIEKDSFAYFGNSSKIRTPTEITNPHLIHIGNWVSFGRYGKIQMQTDFTNGDKYIKQHYPNTKCIFQKGILGPRAPFLKIGDGSSIHDNFLISCNDSITLGRHVGLANGVFLSDANHIYHNKDIPPLKSPNEFGKPIRIDDFCWLGINTVVLPGVSIGKQCVVAANSVVTKDVPDYTMVIGNPARHLPLKSFFQSYEKRILKEEQT